jgi:hypothetical protein
LLEGGVSWHLRGESLADWNWVLAGAVLCGVAGCGGDPAGPKASGGASAGGSAGTSPDAGSGGGGASSGGSATAGSSSGGSAAGGGSCLGQFAEARPVVAEDPMMNINGISVTADELELYYARGSSDGVTMQRQIVRRSRSAKSEIFGPVEPLPELAGVCGELPYVNPDISEDGLTLYVTCTQQVETGLPEGVSPLRVARRAARGGAFTLEAQPIGGVFASAGISSDELTAYTDGEVFDTAPQLFTRAAETDMFTGPQPVPGITTPLRSLDISSDGLALFGAANPGSGTAIYRAVRPSPSEPFAAPQELSLALRMVTAAQNPALGAPNISAGCTLYLVVALQQGYFVFAAAPQ